MLGITLSPPNRRRWQRFKAHRFGYYSLWILIGLLLICLFAEGLANDRPLLIRYDHNWYLPIVHNYAETTFGGEFNTPADYHDPYVVDLIQQKGWMLWPLIPYRYDTISYDTQQPAPSAPSRRHWLGTDDNNRDVLARVIYGFRLSVLFGFTLTLLSALIGVAAGAIQGFYGGWVDLGLQRVIEIWSGLPTLFMLIILASIITPGFWVLLGFTLLFGWMGFVGVVRAECLRARNFEYVWAARALGMSDRRIIVKHVLPNALVATLTLMPFTLSGSVITLTSLDFLGFGLPPGSPSLGELLAQGKANLQAPWLGVTAFVVLGGLMALLVFIGEGVRDAFDPRH